MTDFECGIVRDAFPILDIPASKCCDGKSIGCTNGTITSININYRRFRSPLPANLGDLTNLKNLTLSQNGFTGSIPEDWVRLAKLENLKDLSMNLFSGPIPIEWSNLSNMKHLNLGRNIIGGSLTPWLGDLTKLSTLISGNYLTGRVPAWMSADQIKSDIRQNCFKPEELPVQFSHDYQRPADVCKAYYGSDSIISTDSPRSPPPIALIAGATVAVFAVFLAAIFGFISFRRRNAFAKTKNET
ncbi:hypothetical protein HDU97_006057 [Phlyctochytrium planicorne]|nr:hypothetical protein HDU97_006057 [Phlyctochytrium planicorne]